MLYDGQYLIETATTYMTGTTHKKPASHEEFGESKLVEYDFVKIITKSKWEIETSR